MMVGIQMRDFEAGTCQILDLRAPFLKDCPHHWNADLNLPNRITVEVPVFVNNACQSATALMAERFELRQVQMGADGACGKQRRTCCEVFIAGPFDRTVAEVTNPLAIA
jgi:hypothetical protein